MTATWTVDETAWPGGGIAIVKPPGYPAFAYGVLSDDIWVGRDTWGLLPASGSGYGVGQHTGNPAIFMVDHLEGYIGCGTQRKILHTLDGWQTIDDTIDVSVGGVPRSAHVVFAFGSTIWAADVYNGQVLRSTDYGASWTMVFEATDDNFTKDLYVESASEAWFCWKESWDGNYESIVHLEHTVNGGSGWTTTTWSGVNDLTYMDGYGDLLVITPWWGNNGRGPGYHWHFKVSTDGGANWLDRQLEKEIITPIWEELNTISDVSVTETGEIYLASNYGSIFKSVDTGLNWERISGPDIYNGINNNFYQIAAGHGMIVAADNSLVMSYAGEMSDDEPKVFMNNNQLWSPL